MQVVLVMFRADGERRSFSLPRTVTVIGRREDCDLRIPLGDVSRKHCRFIADNDTLKVEDLGSSNGTFHNGVRIQEAIVNAGDNVQVGPVMFVVQIDGVPADEEIQPPAAGAPAAADDTHTPPADIQVDELEEVSDEIPDAGEAPMEQLEDAAIAHLDAAEAEEGINVDVDMDEVEVEEIAEELPEEDEADHPR
jgi:predicted component of type VI protein secretion system